MVVSFRWFRRRFLLFLLEHLAFARQSAGGRVGLCVRSGALGGYVVGSWAGDSAAMICGKCMLHQCRHFHARQPLWGPSPYRTPPSTPNRDHRRRRRRPYAVTSPLFLKSAWDAAQ